MATLTPLALRPAGVPCLALAAILVALSPAADAQSYRDFTTVRNRTQPYRSLVQIRAGYRGTEAEGPDNLTTGHASDDSIDGFILYHTKDLARGEDWVLDAYAGQDGLYAGIKNDLYGARRSQSRLEVFGRPRAFYRQGYYLAGDYVPTGLYEGTDWTVQFATGQVVDKGLLLDISLFYKNNSFDKTDEPPTNTADFVLPDDHNAYGTAVSLEQNTIELDRTLGIPKSGLLWWVRLEYERNDSDRSFGWTVTGTRKLSKGYYRGETHLELYAPNGRTAAWEITLDAGYVDKTDTIAAYHSENVPGYIRGDGTLGYRVSFGQSVLIKPYAQLQYSKSLAIDGRTSRDKVFWGGGLSGSYIFSNNLALVLDYSYVDNPSRGHVSLERDFYGEHQFFVGMDVSFGSGYRN